MKRTLLRYDNYQRSSDAPLIKYKPEVRDSCVSYIEGVFVSRFMCSVLLVCCLEAGGGLYRGGPFKE